MAFPKKYTDREYMEMVYSMLSEMSAAARVQHGAMLNSLANVQSSFIDLQKTLSLLARGLEERSEQRYQQEVHDLELQIEGFRKLLEEKKNNILQPPIGKTSQDIEKIALSTYNQQQTMQLAEQQKASIARKIKWQDLAIGAIVSYVAVQLAIQLFQLLSK